MEELLTLPLSARESICRDTLREFDELCYSRPIEPQVRRLTAHTSVVLEINALRFRYSLSTCKYV